MRLRLALLLAAACAEAASPPENPPEDLCADKDLATDPANCGTCRRACDAGLLCRDGDCVAPPACEEGETVPCYDGPDFTRSIGLCRDGVRTCANGAFGACEGQVVPSAADVCGNELDDDCNGAVDDAPDRDGDGFAGCEDCCDDPADCPEPTAVNPRAMELPDNAVDDDCDGTTDVLPEPCDPGLPSAPVDLFDYARALDLCANLPADIFLAQADGGPEPSPVGHAIRPSFGAMSPRRGGSMVVLSTGTAAAPGQVDPAHASFDGHLQGTRSGLPQGWVGTDGPLPAAPGCPAISTNVHDSQLLVLRLQVPTNARAFAIDVRFLSAEFPEWTCSTFNDVFVALLDEDGVGQARNLAVFVDGAQQGWPVGTTMGGTGLFTTCVNGATGCGFGVAPGAIDTCTGSADLAGTSLDAPAPGVCDANALAGGGTAWLTLSGNVTPGSQVLLRLGVWDSGDGQADSLVLLDHLRFLADPVIVEGAQLAR